MRLRILNAEPERYAREAIEVLTAVADVDLRSLDRRELLQALPRYDALIVRLSHRVDRELLRAGTSLRAVVSATTGLDHIDLAEAERRGIAVLSLRGEVEFLRSIHATAEHTWALLLAVARRIVPAARSVCEGTWNRDAFRGVELHGRVLGVVGYGRLGEKVAHYGLAFGMQTLVFDPYVEHVPEPIERCASLHALLARCDVVSVHVPLGDATVGLIGSAELAAMKPGALLINTSRGGVLDEAALLDRLKSRHLAAAALDVLRFETADGTGDSQAADSRRLIEYARDHDNLLITPHIGGATGTSMEKTEVFMARKLRDYLTDVQPAASARK